MAYKRGWSFMRVDPFTKWLDKHQSMGGYVASSYVNWDILADPGDDIVKLLEQFKDLPFDAVMEFAEAHTFDNDMGYRDICEDASKLFFLTELVQFNELLYYPQIIHEPWFDRYRVHPGSGRLQALWLCGYNSIKCIYTHFNEPEFIPPGDCFEIKNKWQFDKEIMLRPDVIKWHFETYQAFPKDKQEQVWTKRRDREWEWDHIKTDKPWNFIRFSEGPDFHHHKKLWRSYAIDGWQDLQHDHVQIGSTVFEFNHKGKVTDVKRFKNIGSKSY